MTAAPAGVMQGTLSPDSPWDLSLWASSRLNEEVRRDVAIIARILPLAASRVQSRVSSKFSVGTDLASTPLRPRSRKRQDFDLTSQVKSRLVPRPPCCWPKAVNLRG